MGKEKKKFVIKTPRVNIMSTKKSHIGLNE